MKRVIQKTLIELEKQNDAAIVRSVARKKELPKAKPKMQITKSALHFCHQALWSGKLFHQKSPWRKLVQKTMNGRQLNVPVTRNMDIARVENNACIAIKPAGITVA